MANIAILCSDKQSNCHTILSVASSNRFRLYSRRHVNCHEYSYYWNTWYRSAGSSYVLVLVSTGSKVQRFIREAHKDHEIMQYIDLTQYTASCSEGMKMCYRTWPRSLCPVPSGAPFPNNYQVMDMYALSDHNHCPTSSRTNNHLECNTGSRHS